MGGNLIGIVKVQTEYDGIKYYIGPISLQYGESLEKERDEVNIAETGARFPENAGELLMP